MPVIYHCTEWVSAFSCLYLLTNHHWIISITTPEKVKDALTKIIRVLVDSDEARSMARVHRELIDYTRKTRDELEDYLLLHHIPGRCSLCKKLGGQ